MIGSEHQKAEELKNAEAITEQDSDYSVQQNEPLTDPNDVAEVTTATSVAPTQATGSKERQSRKETTFPQPQTKYQSSPPRKHCEKMTMRKTMRRPSKIEVHPFTTRHRRTMANN